MWSGMDQTIRRVQARRKALSLMACVYCPPGRGENASRQPRHGAKKRKAAK